MGVSDVAALAAQYGTMGIMVAYLILREKHEREFRAKEAEADREFKKEQAAAERDLARERINADLELARSMTLLTATIQRLN